MLHLQPITELDAGHAVCGMAQLRHRIFVVCLESSNVTVFSDCPPYNRLADIVVDSMNDPNDIAACPNTGHLYIVDWGYHCVWKVSDVDDSGRSPTVSKWITSMSPWAVSVGPTGRVLVTPRLVASCSGQCLYRYEWHYTESRPDSKLVEEIPLSAGINVEHAIETYRNTFVICYTRFSGRMTSADSEREDSDDKSAISELDIDGAVLRSFSIPLDWPRHVTMVSPLFESADESASEVIRFRFLVSDFNGGRVVMFDDQLILNSVVLTDTELSQPRRLSFQRSTQTLLVGQYNGIVVVYRTEFSDGKERSYPNPTASLS